MQAEEELVVEPVALLRFLLTQTADNELEPQVNDGRT